MAIKQFIFLIFIISTFVSHSQKLTGDSLYINFGDSVNKHLINSKLNTFNDKRTHLNKFIYISEKKRYLFFPIDKYYDFSKPINTSFEQLFDKQNNNNITNLTLYNFKVSPEKMFFKTNIRVDVSLYIDIQNDDDSISGLLIYENQYNRADKKNEIKNIEQAVEKWKAQFEKDVTTIISTGKASGELLFNFRPGIQQPKKNMLVSSDFVIGLDFFMVEGDIVFSSHEPQKKYVRKGSVVRYRNSEKFESIGFGQNVIHKYHRINKNWQFEIKSAFLVGINKWKDLDENSRKLEEIVTFDYTITPKIVYNKFENNSFLFGFGTMLNLYYIISNKPSVKPGFAVMLGYKL